MYQSSIMFKSTHLTCIFWIIICILAIGLEPARSVPVDENEISKGRECKTFCGSCGCIGFYCGEECICECNVEKNDTECIALIQANAKRMKVPFEILIQGPSTSRFLRNALQFDQNQQQCSKGDSARTKRSTVVIYKPVTGNTLNTLDPNGYCERPLDKVEGLPRDNLFRGRRAVDGESWFTDVANNLVKPAPIQGRHTSETEYNTEEEDENQTKEQDTSSSDEEILPKIRGKIKDTFGDSGTLVKGIRKTVKKIENKAIKAIEFENTAKKLRGAISTLRNRAEDILLPVPEQTDSNPFQSHGKRLLNKLRGRLFNTFADEETKEEESVS